MFVPVSFVHVALVLLERPHSTLSYTLPYYYLTWGPTFNDSFNLLCRFSCKNFVMLTTLNCGAHIPAWKTHTV